MADAKFSDIDKKVYPTDECYSIQIKKLDDRTFIEADLHKSQKGETVENVLKLALQNGCKWQQWKKVNDKLTKVDVEKQGSAD